ncbi:ATP-binding cassette domain-containing protein [Embleya sp. NBC_00896]|uniref:ABC transporter ATP-binding protein n=1 Tax=Embleya sp. NBC_00896 TaxID=2975961 RepID=UPI002F90EC51|nr:ATP-binding cassette domain-containing protein [Embleya sp. NBC_00896]
MRPIVEVQALRVEIGGRAIVAGVSLNAYAGKVTAIVGASGSGKTTIGLALLGEYPHGARVGGDVRIGDGPPRVGAVGYVPQHPAAVLNPARPVEALLRDIARRGAGGDRVAIRRRVHEALRLARIPDPEHLLRRFPHQLSGGQQQRVVLAQALLLGARVLVADEPTTGQDALTKEGIVAQLSAAAREGIAVVLLSHDLDVVRRLADEVVVLRHGRVAESGPAERVLTGPEYSARPAPTHRPVPPAPRRVPETSVARLEVRDLVARHRTGGGPVTVVRGANVSVAGGECLALVGRSGGGKTTLGRCVAGLHSAYDGHVLLDGIPLARSLRGRRRDELAAVQYVFQDARAAFDEHRPVLDQVARTAVRLRDAGPKEARETAVRTLACLGLSAASAGRRPSALSGGELQRAALARALLARPRVLVCDEVTSGLDATTRHDLLDLLADLREHGGLALVFITHDLSAAARIADRIAVVDAGLLIEQGPTRQLLTAPRHEFTRSLVHAGRGRRNTGARHSDSAGLGR